MCRTSAELQQHYNGECTIVGTYRVKEFLTKKNTLLANWPVAVLSDGTEVLLESFWKNKTAEKRSRDEKTAWIGKQVSATGRLHSSPPTEPGAQNMFIPCLSPVTELVVVPE